MKKNFLEAVVFICGACVMMLELVGSRLFAPYLGTSLYVWTSLIGVILGCLSLGYWLGGRLSDKRPDPRYLSAIILMSGIATTVIALLGDAVLFAIQSLIADLRLGAVLATLLLFGLPSVLLGMVSPYAVRLKISEISQTGRTTGALYAFSTLGSIAGTFICGFFLLSAFSHRSILLMISVCLVLLSPIAALGMPKKHQWIWAFLFVVISSMISPFERAVMGSGFIESQTAYNRVWIFDAYSTEGKPLRLMQVNDEGSSAMFLDSDELALDYTNYFRLAKHFNPGIKNALMIGGAAFSYPKYFLKEFSSAHLDVVEIDAKLTALARQYFNLRADPRLAVFHEDARTFLNKSQNHYDVIYVDVFRSHTIPFQLATREAFEKMSGHLNENGVLIMNVISSIDGDSGLLLRALIRTLESVSLQVTVFPVQYKDDASRVQNICLVALKSGNTPTFNSSDEILNEYLNHIWVEKIPRDTPILTDGFAPVDQYTAKMLAHRAESKEGILQKKVQWLWQKLMRVQP